MVAGFYKSKVVSTEKAVNDTPQVSAAEQCKSPDKGRPGLVTGLFSKKATAIKRAPEQDDSDKPINPRALAKCSDKRARDLVPYEAALKLKILPLSVISDKDEKILSCAAGQEVTPQLIQELRFISGCSVRLVPIALDPLLNAIFEAYKGDENRLSASLLGVTIPSDQSSNPPPLPAPTGEPARFLALLIDYAIARGASDIHLIPCAEGTTIRIRVDGNLLSHDGPLYAKGVHKNIVARLRILARLPSLPKLGNNEGTFEVPTATGKRSVRLSILSTVHGEKVVLRLHGNHTDSELDKLGLDSRLLDSLQNAMNQQEGMIIFAGPTGSGKSTTMYAILKELQKRSLSIATIEDPVESYLDGISQTNVSEFAGITFASGVKAILRQDPDVIMIGEMRDHESAKVSIHAALTGHLVLSTVHARDSLEVFLRLKTLGIDPLTISQAIKLIVSQRLLPRLCKKCSVLDLKNSNALGFQCYQAVGCRCCDYLGIQGRVLITEHLELSKELRQDIIKSDCNVELLRKITLDCGLRTFSEATLELLKSGTIAVGDL